MVIKDIQNVRGNYDMRLNAYLAANEPAIFHCHHYNCFLQAVIQDTVAYLPLVNEILNDSAQEIAYQQFSHHFSNNDCKIDERKSIVSDYYSFAGFGQLDFTELNNQGGTVSTKYDHYGIGWLSKFGKSDKPVSLFTAGFISGAVEAIYNLKLGSLQTEQELCLSKGDDVSSFTVRSSAEPRKLELSQGAGTTTPHELAQPHGTNISYDAIRNAITGLPIQGSAEDGMIHAFGVMLTRHYANYYTNISNRFIDYFKQELGDEAIENAKVLLVEAGHTCAFNTFGGVMQSNEWNGLIKPMCQSKEDWIHGIVAVVNGFGWGFWEVEELIPNEKLRIRIYNGYESNSYLKKYGNSRDTISYLAQGGTAGLMNLVYVLNIPENSPATLDEALYKQIHDSEDRFIAKQLECRTMGADYDLFEATKIS